MHAFLAYVLITETWKQVGCYQNRGRALGEILFKPKRRAKISAKYQQCVAEADTQGATLFGFDDNKCWKGANAASSYDMYGKAEGKCGSTKRGLRYGFMASETMFVYQKKEGNGMSVHDLQVVLKVYRRQSQRRGRLCNAPVSHPVKTDFLDALFYKK